MTWRGSLVRGYVLHQRPWRNTSMLVEAFTADAGRIGLVARGVRRRRSNTQALLVPFQPLLLSWTGRGELHTLTGVEAERWRPAPSGPALLAGYYCSELVLRLLGRDDPHPDAFDAYDRAIAALAAGAGPDAPLRRFELALLDALGYAPPLARDADTGEPIDAAAAYDYLPEHGPRAAAGPAASGAVRVPGAHLRALAAGELDDPAVLRSAQRVLQATLTLYLGPRPLKSRAIYRAMYGDR